MNLIINEEFKKLIPPLNQEEYKLLEENILENGITDDIQIWCVLDDKVSMDMLDAEFNDEIDLDEFRNFYIVDGHNRYEIAQKHNLEFNTKELEFVDEEEAKIYILEKQLGRRNINGYVRLELTEKLEPLLKQKAKEKERIRKSKNDFVKSDKVEDEDEDFLFHTKPVIKPVDTRKEIAKLAGVSTGTKAKFDKIKNVIDDNTKQKLRTGEIAIDNVFKQIKTEQKKEEIKKLKEDIDEGKIILPDGTFEIIMMDVPWNYGTQYDAGSRRVGNPYPEMSLEEIYNLSIPASKDCILFFWTTQKFLEESFKIIKHYGFEYKGLIVWDKEDMGMGATLRMQCEFCMLAFKGKPIWNITDMRDIIHEKRREHSRKPDTLYNIINDKLPGRRLDYFSRENREGWQTFGYEKFTN